MIIVLIAMMMMMMMMNTVASESMAIQFNLGPKKL